MLRSRIYNPVAKGHAFCVVVYFLIMAKTRWTYDETMKFVHLYEAEPVLWNTSDKNYTHKPTRGAALDRIVRGLDKADFDVKDCRLKIKNLRSHYWQEINRIQASLATGEVYKPTVVWFTVLDRFLWRFTNFVPTKDLEIRGQKEIIPITYVNVSDQIADEESAGAADDLLEDLVKTEEPEGENQTDASENLNVPDSEGPIKRIRISSSVSLPAQEALRKLERIHSEVRNAARETEFDIWAKSVAKQLNNMEPKRALDVQLKMQSVLTSERILLLDDPISSGIK